MAITKADVADPTTVRAMEAAVAQLNGAASVSVSFAGAEGRKVGLEIIEFLTRTPEQDLFSAVGISGEHEDEHEHHHGDQCDDGHASAHSHHDERIESFVFKWGSGATWAAYATWLEQLSKQPASDLMRVKGLLQLDGAGPPYVVQGVQHTFSKPVRMASWPTADEQSWLVVIARGIRRASLEAIFHPETAQAEKT